MWTKLNGQYIDICEAHAITRQARPPLQPRHEGPAAAAEPRPALGRAHGGESRDAAQQLRPRLAQPRPHQPQAGGRRQHRGGGLQLGLGQLQRRLLTRHPGGPLRAPQPGQGGTRPHLQLKPVKITTQRLFQSLLIKFRY